MVRSKNHRIPIYLVGEEHQGFQLNKYCFDHEQSVDNCLCFWTMRSR